LTSKSKPSCVPQFSKYTSRLHLYNLLFRSWGQLNCDALVQAAADKVAQIVAVDAMHRQESAAQHAADKAAEAKAKENSMGGKKETKQELKKERARDEKAKTAALPSVDKDNAGTHSLD